MTSCGEEQEPMPVSDLHREKLLAAIEIIRSALLDDTKPVMSDNPGNCGWLVTDLGEITITEDNDENWSIMIDLN